MDEEGRPLPLEPPEPPGHTAPQPRPAPPRMPLVPVGGAPPPPDLAHTDVPCVGCGYNLRGLEASGKCPECGLDISRSLHGDQLVYSGSAYLASLCRGIRIIFAALIAQVALLALGIAAGAVVFGLVGGGSASPAIETLVMGLALLADVAVAIVLIFGWWLFSTPDPSIVSANTGNTARKFVRIAVIISGVTGLLSSLEDVCPVTTASSLAIISSAAEIVSIAAWVVSFFASMIYIRWLAKRIPNEHVDRAAKRLMWLGPLLMVVGAFCLMLGPLVAFILYIMLIFRLQQDILAVQAEQVRRFG